MSTESAAAFVLKLSEMLVGKQVDTCIVRDALTRICEFYSFDSGLIYESDQDNCFHLKERCVSQDTNIRESFRTEEINPQYREHLAKETLSHMAKSPHASSNELKFLELFFATSLLAVSMVDANYRICGFIVLLNTQRKEKIPDAEMKTASALLHLLGKYIGIRIYQNKLSFARTTLESILDNMGIDIYVNDFFNHDILYANKSMTAPYGGISRFLGHKCWEVLFPGQCGPCEFCPQKKLIDEHGNPTKVYSWDYQRPFDGAWFRVFSAAFRWVDGRLAHVVSSADITENKRNEELIHYMANYDALTKLPNRRMLISECERRITRAKRAGKGYLLFFDIDGFKAINDSFGHDAGDEFLVRLGEFFSGIPMLAGSSYRNGGDEFVALLDGDVTEANIRNLAHFIHERFKKPWVLKKGDVFCNASIGVACYPEDGSTAEELLNKADQAMYQIKKSGGSGICFGHELLPAGSARGADQD